MRITPLALAVALTLGSAAPSDAGPKGQRSHARPSPQTVEQSVRTIDSPNLRAIRRNGSVATAKFDANFARLRQDAIAIAAVSRGARYETANQMFRTQSALIREMRMSYVKLLLVAAGNSKLDLSDIIDIRAMPALSRFSLVANRKVAGRVVGRTLMTGYSLGEYGGRPIRLAGDDPLLAPWNEAVLNSLINNPVDK